MALPVGVMIPPLLSTAPPLSVSPTKPDAPALKFVQRRAVTGTLVAASVPPNVTWKPVVAWSAAAAEVGDRHRRPGGQDGRQRRLDPSGRVVDAVRDQGRARSRCSSA